MRKLFLAPILLISILLSFAIGAYAGYPTVTEHPKLYPFTDVQSTPYNCDPTGVVNCAAALENLKANQSNTGDIYLPHGTYLIGTNLTIPAGMTLWMENGAIFSISTGVTLTINGGLKGEITRKFSCIGTSKVDLSNAKIDYIYPEWWYSGSGDFSLAIQAAIDSRSLGYGNNILLTGNYTCQTQINVKSHTHIIGLGRVRTSITFNPSSSQILWNFADPLDTDMCQHFTLKGMSMYAGSNVQHKEFIRLYDVGYGTIEDINIYDVTGSDSIGLLIKGRMLVTVKHFICTIDAPVIVGVNPHSSTSKIVMDQMRFEDCLLICNKSTGVNIVVLNQDLKITNTLFDNVVMNGGLYGFYWYGTTMSLTSDHLTFRNVRYENPTDGAVGFLIDVNQFLYALNMDNVQTDGTKGFLFNYVSTATLINCQYKAVTATPGNAIDLIENHCERIVLINFYRTNGIVETGTMTVNIATEEILGLTPFALYTNSASMRFYINNPAMATLPTYANNAAALSGGLQVGDLYKASTGDPRPVCVVITP